MIMGQSGRYLPKTTHDHDRRPECLKVRLRHNGQNILLVPAVAGRAERANCATAPPVRQLTADAIEATGAITSMG
jgi:hypothetical protein